MKHVILALGLFMGANAFGQKIKVLNFATFHMVYTPDAHKVAFDADDKKNKSETYEIAKALAAFKPTIICVEMVPGKQDQLDHDYGEFLKREDYRAKIGGEIALIAYEVGKLSGVKKIYGIDEQETATSNYNIGNELENPVDSLTAK